MKKLLVLGFAIMLSAVTMGVARTLYIEKALKVKVAGQHSELKAGVSLDEETRVTIPEDGVLVMLDRSTGKRWLVKKNILENLENWRRKRIRISGPRQSLCFTPTASPKPKRKRRGRLALQ